jgi:hypothetical protein
MDVPWTLDNLQYLPLTGVKRENVVHVSIQDGISKGSVMVLAKTDT